MLIKFLGAADRVGGSAVLLDTGKKRFLFDYGNILDEDTRKNFQRVSYPPFEEVDAIFISHAHMDHMGGLYHLISKEFRSNIPIFMTLPTMSIGMLLLKNSIQIIDGFVNHGIMHKLYQLINLKKYNETFNFGNYKFTFFNSGHVLGASLIYMEGDNKRICYTGDVNTNFTLFQTGIHIPEQIKNVDLLILESTYALKSTPPLGEEEYKFMSAVRQAVSQGFVLIPVFAFERSLRVSDLLIREGIDHTIVSSLIFHLILKTKSLLKGKSKRYLGKIKQHLKRKKHVLEDTHALDKGRVILTTSGMLSGGFALDLLPYLTSGDSVILPGYCVKGTNGRYLLDEHKVYIHGKEVNLNHVNVLNFSLSAHAPHEGLMKIVKEINPKQICVVHGDNTSDFAKYLNDNGYNAYAPSNRESIII